MKSNENIYTTDLDIVSIHNEVEHYFGKVLDALKIDWKNDYITKDTPKRVAQMYVNEIFKGRYIPRPKVKEFINAKNYDDIYTVNGIELKSFCAHHFLAIKGKAYIGVIPSEKLIGLSKFARILEWVFSRPQIQEEATIQLADELENIIKPKGLYIIIKAKHSCMTMRGIKNNNSQMVTSVIRGIFKQDKALQKKFMSMIK